MLIVFRIAFLTRAMQTEHLYCHKQTGIQSANRGLLRLLCLLIMLHPLVSHAVLYRWIDKSGKTHYSDSIPPTESQLSRAKLNKNAQTVRIIEAAKTAEEFHFKRQLAHLRKKKKGLLNAQRRYDRTLLNTFRKVTDLEIARAEKLDSMDVLINIASSNIRRLNIELRKQQQRAANTERNGTAVPVKLLKRIEYTRTKVAENTQSRRQYEFDKSRISEKFGHDINRFKELTSNAFQGNLRPRTVSPNFPHLKTLGFVECDSRENCQKIWKLTRKYVARHATTGVQLVTEKLIYSFHPQDDKDIGVSASKIVEPGKKTRIFVDIRCKFTSVGRENCNSPRGIQIPSEFPVFIKNAKPKHTTRQSIEHAS